jgi:hypothetical protein
MMLIALLLTTLCTPAPSSALPAPLPSFSFLQEEEEEELPDKRPEIKELLEGLKDHAGARGEEDSDALGVMDKLTQEFPKSGPKDRAAIVKGLGKCFDQRRKELEGGIKNNKLFIGAATSLGTMGTDATKTLTKWVGNKKHRKDLLLQQTLIRALGATGDPKAVRCLLDQLNNKEDVLIGTAAEALGEFTEADQKIRKEIFNELLKLLMTNLALSKDPNNLGARDRYDVVAAPIITSLQRLSGDEERRRPEGWQRWWNKNKKKDWDEEED